MRLNPTRTPRACRGVTLIELLVAVTVLGILLMVAVPSFQDAFLNNKLSNQANGFLSSLMLARSEAIKRNGRVVVCKSANGADCVTSGNWAQGWIVFHDANGNSLAESGESVIQRGDPLEHGFHLRGNTAAVADRIAFSSSGAVVEAGTLTLCRFSPSVGGSNRAIDISTTGRAAILKDQGNLAQCP